MNSATDISAINKLPRDRYGAFDVRQVLSLELQVQVTAFLGDAVKAGHLPEPFITGTIFDLIEFSSPAWPAPTNNRKIYHTAWAAIKPANARP